MEIEEQKTNQGHLIPDQIKYKIIFYKMEGTHSDKTIAKLILSEFGRELGNSTVQNIWEKYQETNQVFLSFLLCFLYLTFLSTFFWRPSRQHIWNCKQNGVFQSLISSFLLSWVVWAKKRHSSSCLGFWWVNERFFLLQRLNFLGLRKLQDL